MLRIYHQMNRWVAVLFYKKMARKFLILQRTSLNSISEYQVATLVKPYVQEVFASSFERRIACPDSFRGVFQFVRVNVKMLRKISHLTLCDHPYFLIGC